MLLDFRIDWGYQYLYSRRHYHPTYVWDGKLSCEKGEIKKIYKREYPVIWYGIGYNAEETEISGNTWEDKTKRRLSGIRVVAEVNDETEFTLETASCDLKFKASEVLEKGVIEIPVGPKYLACFVTVTKTEFYRFRAPVKENETLISPDELNLPVCKWARMRTAWLKDSVDFSYDVKESKADICETLIHIEAMASLDPKRNGSYVNTYIPFELYCDGKLIGKYNYFFRKHDGVLEIMDDLWLRVEVPSGKHTFTIKNNHDKAYLVINRILITQSERNDKQLSVPSWAIKGEKIVGKVFSVDEKTISVNVSGKTIDISCKKGWNEFSFICESDTEISTESSKASVEVFDVCEEKYPVKVGYDMTQINHDDNGEMDWLLDYTARTRLGNYVVFRSFLNDEQEFDKKLKQKWGKFCDEHGIYVSAATSFGDGEIVKWSGEHFNDCGLHEYPGKVYAFDPKEPYASKDMKEACEHYMDCLKIEIDKAHKVADVTGFGDASGGIRYSFLAGVDIVRAETMVGHTMTLLSQARPAAEALGQGRWGVHIAIQHSYYPYKDTHMGQYYLSLMQPWIMGAEMIYEEDSLFGMWSEEKQGWGDKLTKGKRDMTRNFYKFVKTHPRMGKNVRNIAFIEGRYAAPFNGFICDVEQDPHYSVWGLFGNNAPEWGHCQPEKSRQLLDVLMPGASTHPLRQKFEKRRFFFSGTPFGDFDCIPVEADSNYYKNYKLLLNLGWNTAIDEDMEKLKEFVKNGGTLLTGIPQFSKHKKREFLKDMKELDLYDNSLISDFLGMDIISEGVEYSGQWNSKSREIMVIPELSAMPSDSAEEDGKAMLAEVKLKSAEIIAWDKFSGKPMLVRNKYGDGYVYTFTLWAYPGHEKFQEFAAAWIYKLSDENKGDIFVEDSTNEVFWSVRKTDDKTIIMMLNTDWTSEGNVKNVNLVVNGKRYPVEVKEQELTIAEITGNDVEIKKYTL